jgi:hypothetical protein
MAAKLVTKSNFRILIKSILRYVRQLTKNPVIAVLTVILLIAAYIGLLYFALVYGLRHSSTSIFKSHGVGRKVGMNQRILTVVSATVDLSREAELLAGFRSLLMAPVPDGLLRTELLRSAPGAWRIHTLWTDRDALDKMRAATEAPAAPRLFRSVGADPSLEIFEVMVEHVPDE